MNEALPPPIMSKSRCLEKAKTCEQLNTVGATECLFFLRAEPTENKAIDS
jgi:hypothetical protein